MKSLRPRVQRSRSCTIRRAHAAPRSATRYVDHPVFLTQTRALILTSLRQVRRRLAPGVYEKAQALFVYAKQATLHALFAGTLTTPGLDRGKSCVGLRGVSPRDGYLAQNTTQGTQENLPTAAEARASIRAGLPTF